jgi:predicted nucleotide-binding protein (sugar kinase/HSP70/actin superfamily)
MGIPRALTAHSLYPLYSTFFSRLGMDVILSGVDASGAMKANSGFCYPVQIAHGAVMDLIKTGTDFIFLPQISRMPNPRGERDSYLCPLAQASPYITAKAFPNAKILSPVLDFALGYEASVDMVELAESQLGFSREEAQQAYRLAVGAQLEAEQSMLALGRSALKEALADGKPTILLVGRSYNAFPPEASQSVSRKLASMGVRVIPGDCLPQERGGQTVWHYPNVILNAVALAKQHYNLFLLHVSNFSCTIDAFTQSFFLSELGDKPYLMLEIDAHTADAGIQTRLEAFWDILRNYRREPVRASAFEPASIGLDAVVTTSAGQRIPLTDPRVRIRFPSFSHYHSQAVTLGAQRLGLNVGPAMELSRSHLERGLQHASGRECLPLPICLGQMLEAHQGRAPGEVVGFYMFAGGAPCVVDCYVEYLRQFIRDNQLEDLFIFDPRGGATTCTG